MDHASGDNVQYDECLPAGDSPGRSADAVGWGPHNVLHVVMRWSIKFYVESLLTPSSEIAVRQHPLVYRPDEASEEVVVGAKWAFGLLPEVRYPAEARICVSTGANLLVYRVGRRGNHKTYVSKGIGLGLCFSTADLAKDERTARKGARESKQPRVEPSQSAGADAASPSESDAHQGYDLSTRQSAGEGSIPIARGLSVESKQTSSQVSEDTLSDEESSRTKRKRQKAKSLSKHTKVSKKVLSEKKQKSQGSSSMPHSSTKKTRTKDLKTRNFSYTRHQHPLVDYFWTPEDVLLVITTDGVYLVNFLENFDDEMTPQLLTLPNASYKFREDIFGIELAFPSAATMVKCSREVASSMRESHNFSYMRDRVLIVASAFVLRIFHVEKDKVQLLRYVEARSLTALPSCLCAFWGLTRSGTPKENFLSSHLRVDDTTEDAGGRSPVQIRVIIATALGVAYGCFPLDLAPFQRNREAAHQALSVPWTPLTTEAPGGFAEHLFVKGIHLHSLDDLRPFVDVAAPATSAASTIVPEVSPWAVLGVSCRCLFAMILGSGDRTITMVPLFRCPLLADATKAPADAAVAVCGVAVHPSHTLAVVLVRMGCPRHDPLQLYPVSVDAKEGFLRRLLELHDALKPLITCKGPLERPTPDDTITSPERTNASLADSENGMTVVLSKQCRSSYFLWEMLFPKSHDALSMRSYRDSWRGFVAEVPSNVLDSAPQLSTPLRRPKVRGIVPFLSNKTPVMAEQTIQQWRQQYLQLRARYGVELFLRYLPSTGEREEDHYLEIATSNSDSSALGKFWCTILRGLWRRRPHDATPLYEIILANAIRVIGLRAGYAGLQLAGEETFWQVETHKGASVSPYELNYAGAVAFARFYLQEQKKGADGDGALVRWCHSAAWVESIQTFLSKLGVSAEGGAGTALFSRMYPCSVCDTAQAACFSWSFMFDSTHTVAHNGEEVFSETSAAAQEVHTTVFSPRTFSPLSVYSEAAVLTSCLGCGFCDFVVGPFCRICGGLLK